MNPARSPVTPATPSGVAAPVGKLGNSSQVLVRHDFKRALYRALLSEFEVGEVVEYFSRIPLVMEGRAYSQVELFELLWSEKAKLPLCYEYATDNILEDFLNRKGRTLGPLMKKVLWLNNNSSVIPGKVVLGWFYPKIEALFTSLDARDIVFSLISLHNEAWLPGTLHRRVKKWEEGGWVKSIMAFIADHTHQEYLDWDFEIIGGCQVLAAPMIVGLPPFEKLEMLADTRPPESVIQVDADKPVRVGGGVEDPGRSRRARDRVPGILQGIGGGFGRLQSAGSARDRNDPGLPLPHPPTHRPAPRLRVRGPVLPPYRRASQAEASHQSPPELHHRGSGPGGRSPEG
jgi:hypothetical protein